MRATTKGPGGWPGTSGGSDLRTAGDRRTDGLREIAYEIARLEERRRPGEFRESLAPGTSVEEGIRERSEAMFRELAVGDVDLVVGRLFDVSEGCDACMRRAEGIERRIRALRRRAIPDSIFETARARPEPAAGTTTRGADPRNTLEDSAEAKL